MKERFRAPRVICGVSVVFMKEETMPKISSTVKNRLVVRPLGGGRRVPRERLTYQLPPDGRTTNSSANPFGRFAN